MSSRVAALMPEALCKIPDALASILAALQSVPDEVPFLVQRHPARCHRLTLRVRNTLCQKRTPSSATEVGNPPVALT